MAANYNIAFNKAATITKSDTVDFPLSDAVFVGGAGTVAAVFQDGSVVDFEVTTVPDILPLRIKRVNSTGTDATLMVALYQV